jgi:tetratricopeptide (TPR) repeat protein
MRKKNLVSLLIFSMMMVPCFYSLYGQDGENPGVRMFKNKNYYGSERYFKEVLASDAENGQAYFYLGRIATEKRELENASDQYEKAIEVDPNNADFYAWAGINYVHLLSEVDFMKQAIYAPRALKNLEKAVELDPGHIEARIWLAGYYAEAPSFAGGSREKAKEQFARIFALDPLHKRALLQQGIILTSFQEYDSALVSFEKILGQHPDYYPAYFHIGRLSKESKMFYTQGELSLRKFIGQAGKEFASSKDEAWWYLGQIYQQQDKTDDARKAFENALSLDPENEEYQKSLKNL